MEKSDEQMLSDYHNDWTRARAKMDLKSVMNTTDDPSEILRWAMSVGALVKMIVKPTPDMGKLIELEYEILQEMAK